MRTLNLQLQISINIERKLPEWKTPEWKPPLVENAEWPSETAGVETADVKGKALPAPVQFNKIVALILSHLCLLLVRQVM